MRSRRIPYNAAEMAWLEANRTLVISDYHREFVAAFERGDVTAAHLHGLRKRMNWKVGRAAGRYVGRRRRYSPAEIAWLADNRTMPIGAYHRAFCVVFCRDDVTAAMLHGLRKREGWSTGRTGRFEKGQLPPNKGKRMPSHPNSAKTQFRKGNLPRNHKGPGHERIDSKDGYVILIVEETSLAVIVAMGTADAPRVPTAPEIAAIAAHLETLRPVTAEVIVLAYLPLVQPFTIQLTPDTVANRAAVAAAIADHFAREAQIGEPMPYSRFSEAISAASGEYSHELTVPAGDIVPAARELPLPGAITWLAP